VFIILYSGLTGVLVYYTGQQLEEARKVTRDTNANFRIGQRAWVGVTEFEFDPPTAGRRPATSIAFKNLGPTAARDVSQITEIAVIQSENGSPFVGTGTEAMIHEAIRRMAPRQQGLSYGWRLDTSPPGEIFKETTVGNRNLTPEEVALINAKLALMIAVGRVKYIDIFGDEHLTTFCGYLDIAIGKATKCGDLDKMN
jgi:hypothetical protein